MATTGEATIDFGTAGQNKTDTSVTITGQASILATSLVEAWIMGAASADNQEDEHIIAARLITLTCGIPTVATGFTIYGMSDGDVVGTFKVKWVWS